MAKLENLSGKGYGQRILDGYDINLPLCPINKKCFGCLVAYGHHPTHVFATVVSSVFDRGAPDDHGAMSVTSGVHHGPEEKHLEVGAPLALTRASPNVTQIPRICLFSHH